MQATLGELSGKDFSSFEPRMIADADTKLRSDVAALQANSLLKDGVSVHGAVYDVDSGTVRWI